MILINATQIVVSAGGHSSFKGSMLALYSAGSNIGALTSWLSSDGLVSRGLPRPLLGVIMSLGMVVGHTLLALACTLHMPFLLFVGCLFAGFSMGTMGALGAVVVCELFGSTHLVANYTFHGGTHEVLVWLVVAASGLVYDSHADAKHHCVGSDCFLATHVGMVVANIIGVFAAIVLSYRTRSTYRQSSACAQDSVDDSPLSQ